MFDVGWTELVVIACVAILVVGPKDLPRMLRAFGKTMGNVRRMAGDFRKQFDEAMREAEIADLAKQASSLKSSVTSFEPLEEARKSMIEAQKSVEQSIIGTEADRSIRAEAPLENADAASAEKADRQIGGNGAASTPVSAEPSVAAENDAPARKKAS